MRRVVQITILIVAGELIFGLPFHISRYFRPTMLDVFAFSNTDLGDIFAVYGITAMLSYFPGGVIADQYSARTLLSISLLMTALGGLYMATIPGAAQMALLKACPNQLLVRIIKSSATVDFKSSARAVKPA